ncbi:MAG: hypothetical protein EBS35_07835 [Bacteroidetes bacterium]|nr:hypothetical protein [Bacteroidota bacterium]
MDRNTQLGLLLIFGLFVLWQVVTSPSQEELIKQQKMEDSIILARKSNRDWNGVGEIDCRSNMHDGCHYGRRHKES